MFRKNKSGEASSPADLAIGRGRPIPGVICVALWLIILVPGIAPAQVGVPVLDNDLVTVWDVKLDSGKPISLAHPKLDSVTLFLEGGKIRTIGADGKSSVANRKFGDAIFEPKGTKEKEELFSGGQAHLIVVELKNHPAPAFANKTGYQPSFPRPGSTKVLENNRIIVWDYIYKPGAPTPMHYHNKDALVAYRYDASVKSTTPEGKSTVSLDKAGSVRFTQGDRAHVEALVEGKESIIAIEFK